MKQKKINKNLIQQDLEFIIVFL